MSKQAEYWAQRKQEEKDRRNLKLKNFLESDWFLIDEKFEIEERDNGSFSITTDEFGILDYFPKSDKLLIRKKNQWIKSSGINWIKRHLLKQYSFNPSEKVRTSNLIINPFDASSHYQVREWIACRTDRIKWIESNDEVFKLENISNQLVSELLQEIQNHFIDKQIKATVRVYRLTNEIQFNA